MDGMIVIGEAFKRSRRTQKPETSFVGSEQLSNVEFNAREYEQWRTDMFNAAEGKRHLEDGHQCAECKNKGYIASVVERNGMVSTEVLPCKCDATRRSIMALKRSGLQDVIRDCTFDAFVADEDWRRKTKRVAEDFSFRNRVKANGSWFWAGGQPGSGKTHLCTAICREMLLSGRQVVYMVWRTEVDKLKAARGDAENYMREIERFKRADVLYIDDLFKLGRDKEGKRQVPTPAEIGIAFDIINSRYLDRKKTTLISSELTMPELVDIDEAIASRIVERSADYQISVSPDPNKNYRFTGGSRNARTEI